MKKSLLLSENLVGKQLHYPVLLETMNMEYNNERVSE